jgi:hypothetical protein
MIHTNVVTVNRFVKTLVENLKSGENNCAKQRGKSPRFSQRNKKKSAETVDVYDNIVYNISTIK